MSDYRLLAGLAFLALASCHSRPPALPAASATAGLACTMDGTSPEDLGGLLGRWEIQLVATARTNRRVGTPAGPGVAKDSVRGTLELSHRAARCRGCVSGSLLVPWDSLLSAPVPGAVPGRVPVFAMPAAGRGGAIVVSESTCADCGELVLTLNFESAGDRLCGTWAQRFFSGGDRGTFQLVRRGQR